MMTLRWALNLERSLRHQQIAGYKTVSHTSLQAENTFVKYFIDTHHLRDTKSNSY